MHALGERFDLCSFRYSSHGALEVINNRYQFGDQLHRSIFSQFFFFLLRTTTEVIKISLCTDITLLLLFSFSLQTRKLILLLISDLLSLCFCSASFINRLLLSCCYLLFFCK
ncbi:hypothetical protein D3C74_419160 [compost metagenome]